MIGFKQNGSDMKRILILLLATWSMLPPISQAAQTARATLFCWSFRFQQGENSLGDSTLDLTTVPGTPNGELSAWFDVYTHRANFVLDWMGFPITGQLVLDLPNFADANDNGFDDSFEVSQAISGGSAGQYATGLGGGTITATWSRAAGSSAGTCSLRLVDNMFGDLGTFQHTFEVLEYTGTLAYTPGSNTVSGSLDLTNATDLLLGPINLVKSTNDPKNELLLQSVFLTNAVQQTFDLFDTTDFFRDTRLVTNYYGGVEFKDGNFNTSQPDYYSWELSIDDLNDTDQDGIPDFSDDPQTLTTPRQPLLSLAPGPGNLLLTISGDVGRLHHVLETADLSSGNWLTNLSLTLTNDPQVITLPLPSGPAGFWRISAQW
jgi:hypothetical protein